LRLPAGGVARRLGRLLSLTALAIEGHEDVADQRSHDDDHEAGEDDDSKQFVHWLAAIGTASATVPSRDRLDDSHRRRCHSQRVTPQEPPADTPLDLTRRSFAAAGSGDYDLMMSFYGPESVFDMSAWGLGVHSGETRIRTFFEQWIGAFAEFEMELEEARDLGGGMVFAVALQKARDVRSLRQFQLRHAAIAVWKDGVQSASRTIATSTRHGKSPRGSPSRRRRSDVVGRQVSELRIVRAQPSSGAAVIRSRRGRASTRNAPARL
jgi:hypothetical protein